MRPKSRSETRKRHHAVN